MTTLPRKIFTQELVDVNFNHKTLESLKELIDDLISKYGSDVYVKETCNPHEDYQFAVFSEYIENDESYNNRVIAEVKKAEKQKQKDLLELDRLQKKYLQK